MPCPLTWMSRERVFCFSLLFSLCMKSILATVPASEFCKWGKHRQHLLLPSVSSTHAELPESATLAPHPTPGGKEQDGKWGEEWKAWRRGNWNERRVGSGTLHVPVPSLENLWSGERQTGVGKERVGCVAPTLQLRCLQASEVCVRSPCVLNWKAFCLLNYP